MAATQPRFDAIDALRGAAMLWMTAYHFAFDLNHFGHIRQNFYEDPVWTWQRTGIVSLFLLCAGMGQVVAVQRGQSWPRFARRWVQVAGCAALVSLGSLWMFPRSWISFGVLHGMAVMLLVTRWALVRGWYGVVRGALWASLLIPAAFVGLHALGWGRFQELTYTLLLVGAAVGILGVRSFIRYAARQLALWEALRNPPPDEAALPAACLVVVLCP